MGGIGPSRTACLGFAAFALLAAGCSRVTEQDAWPQAREAAWSEAADFWFDDARDSAERFLAESDGRSIRVIRSGDGPRVKPRSLVALEVEGVEPQSGQVVLRHEILLLVPPLANLPGYSFPSPHGPELSQQSRALLERRKVGFDPSAGPAAVTHWGAAPLPWDGIYRMRVGGCYELPHPTMAWVQGLNEAAPRSFSLPRREASASGHEGIPIVRFTIRSTCAADLRRVEYTYVDWNRDFIPYPRGLRTESWHELHGCAD
jgi:hypothetical protein